MRLLSTLLERLSWILEDAAERIHEDAAIAEATRQSRLKRDTLIDRA